MTKLWFSLSVLLNLLWKGNEKLRIHRWLLLFVGWSTPSRWSYPRGEWNKSCWGRLSKVNDPLKSFYLTAMDKLNLLSNRQLQLRLKRENVLYAQKSSAKSATERPGASSSRRTTQPQKILKIVWKARDRSHDSFVVLHFCGYPVVLLSILPDYIFA